MKWFPLWLIFMSILTLGFINPPTAPHLAPTPTPISPNPPQNIKLVGQISLTSTQTMTSDNESAPLIAADGLYSFVAENTMLRIFAMTRPITISHIESYTAPNRIYDMAVNNKMAYLALGEQGLNIVGSWQFPQYISELGQFPERYSEQKIYIRYVKFAAPYLYVSGDDLWVLDVTEPNNIVVVGFYPGISTPVTISENYIYTRQDAHISVLKFTPPQTELRVKIIDEAKQPISFTATLLLARWGEINEVNLPVVNNMVILPFDNVTLQANWPEMFNGLSWDFYHLYLKPVGHVAIESDLIYPLQHYDLEKGLYTTTTTVTFPGITREIRSDVRSVIELQARPPHRRTLQLVDDNRHPISNIQVSTSMYWSSSNHCGNLQGVEPLSQGVSNQEGRLSIPDGDFIYAFEFREPKSDIPYIERPQYVLKTYDSVFPMRLITRLTETETMIEFRPLQPYTQPVKLIVHQDGKPVSGKSLYAQWKFCPCGSCAEVIATTDEAGRISLDNFYPEKWEWFYFLKGEEFGDIIWDVPVNKLNSSEVINVDLTEK